MSDMPFVLEAKTLISIKALIHKAVSVVALISVKALIHKAVSVMALISVKSKSLSFAVQALESDHSPV